MATHAELQAAADAVDDLGPAPGRLPITLAVVQRVVERGVRAAMRRAATMPEDAPRVLEQHVRALQPLDSSRDEADWWSRAGAFDGAVQAWAGEMIPRAGCPTQALAELYSAHWGFSAMSVARVRGER